MKKLIRRYLRRIRNWLILRIPPDEEGDRMLAIEDYVIFIRKEDLK